MQNLYQFLGYILFFILNIAIAFPSNACSSDSDCLRCQRCEVQYPIFHSPIPQGNCIKMPPHHIRQNIRMRHIPGYYGPEWRCRVATCVSISGCELKEAQSAYNNALKVMYDDITNNNGMCVAQWQASTTASSPCETLLSALNQYSKVSGLSPGKIICNSLGSQDPNCESNVPTDSTFCDGFCNNYEISAVSSEVMGSIDSNTRIRKRWENPNERFYSFKINERRGIQVYKNRQRSSICLSPDSRSPRCLAKYIKDRG